MADRLAVKGQQDRSHIAMNVAGEVRYWTKHLCVTREELKAVIDKVGNSAASVRKELAAKAEKSSKAKPSDEVNADVHGAHASTANADKASI